MADERLTATVRGTVQGVGFRWWVRRQARALALRGWVMNQDDERSVTVVAEGPRAALDDLERRLHQGPSGARVESVTVEHAPASGEFAAFDIVRS
jgi:acylphosphatase